MSVYRIPIIYDNAARIMRPAGVADLIDPSFLGFEPTTILSPAQGNMLKLRDGRLYCSGVSLDAGNYVQRGSDGAVFLDGNSLLSNGGAGKPNLISIDATDGKLVLTADILQNYGIATNTYVEAAFIRMQDYAASTYVSKAALPDKLSAYTATFATTTELDTLRARVYQLETSLQNLLAQFDALRDRLNNFGIEVGDLNTSLSTAIADGLSSVTSTINGLSNVYTQQTDTNALRSTVANNKEVASLISEMNARSANIVSNTAKAVSLNQNS